MILEFESFARLISFAIALGILTVVELIFPRRVLTDSKNRRWFENLTLAVINTAFIRIIAIFIPLLPAYLAINMEGAELGLLHIFAMPKFVQIILAVVLLDAVMYTAHVLFHAIPGLWRLHMVHHSDLDFDLTTALRLHPLEVMLTLFVKMGAVYILGAPFLAVVIFEVLLTTVTMFNHSNIRLQPVTEGIIRFLIVTPDMHMVHHSARIDETNSNFGFIFSLWDRVLGSYKAHSAETPGTIIIGLSHNREVKKINLLRLLLMPFVERMGPYSLGNLPVRKKESDLKGGKK